MTRREERIHFIVNELERLALGIKHLAGNVERLIQDSGAIELSDYERNGGPPDIWGEEDGDGN